MSKDFVTFAIYFLGRKIDSEKYLIDFEVKQNQRKIKFLEKCYSDADGDLMMLISEGHCFNIMKKNIESYVENGTIEWRFIIKRKDIVELENTIKEEHSKQNLEKTNNLIEKETSVESNTLLEALRSKWEPNSEKTIETPQRNTNQFESSQKNTNMYDGYQRDQPILRSSRVMDKPKQTFLPRVSNIESNLSHLSLNTGYEDSDSTRYKPVG